MRVALVDPGNFSPQYTANLAAALAREQAQVTLYSSPPQFGEMPAAQGYQVETVFFRGLAQREFFRRRVGARMAAKVLSYPWGLSRLIAAMGEGPGVLHVQWAHLPWLDALAARRLRARGWAWVATAHDLFPEQPFYRWLAPQMRRYLRDADAVIVHTKSLAEDAVRLGTPAERVRVIARGDLGVLRGEELSRGEARSRLGIPVGPAVVLFFGMIKPNKGLENLLNAWARVMAGNGAARLLIVGEALEDPSRYLRQIRDLGIEKGVDLRFGYVPDSQVSAYFYAADLLVLPHTGISLSGVASVGLGYGLPIVATKVGGIGDLVGDEGGAILVEANSVEALADGIRRGLEDLPGLQARARAAGERFRRVNSWEETARKTMALYRDVLAARR